MIGTNVKCIRFFSYCDKVEISWIEGKVVVSHENITIYVGSSQSVHHVTDVDSVNLFHSHSFSNLIERFLVVVDQRWCSNNKKSDW